MGQTTREPGAGVLARPPRHPSTRAEVEVYSSWVKEAISPRWAPPTRWWGGLLAVRCRPFERFKGLTFGVFSKSIFRNSRPSTHLGFKFPKIDSNHRSKSISCLNFHPYSSSLRFSTVLSAGLPLSARHQVRSSDCDLTPVESPGSTDAGLSSQHMLWVV